MKLTSCVLSSGKTEVRFTSRSFVTHGYGKNRLQARQEVVNHIRQHIKELEAALEEKDKWGEHER